MKLGLSAFVGRITLGFALALLLLAFGLTATDVQGTPRPQAPQDFDLILLIDVSGSIATRDPASLRLEVAKLVVDFFQLVLPQTTTSRIGVIRFKGQAEVSIPLTPVHQVSKVDLKADTHPETPEGTDFAAALDMAKDMLDQAKAQSPQPGNWRHVILITDGEPSVPGVVNKEMAYLNQTIGPKITQLKDDFSLHVVGVGHNNYEEFWSKYSYRMVTSSLDLLVIYDLMMTILNIQPGIIYEIPRQEAELFWPEGATFLLFADQITRTVPSRVTLTNTQTGRSVNVALGGPIDDFYGALPYIDTGYWSLRYPGLVQLKGVVQRPLFLLTPIATATPTLTVSPTPTVPASTVVPTISPTPTVTATPTGILGFINRKVALGDLLTVVLIVLATMVALAALAFWRQRKRLRVIQHELEKWCTTYLRGAIATEQGFRQMIKLAAVEGDHEVEKLVKQKLASLRKPVREFLNRQFQLKVPSEDELARLGWTSIQKIIEKSYILNYVGSSTAGDQEMAALAIAWLTSPIEDSAGALTLNYIYWIMEKGKAASREVLSRLGNILADIGGMAHTAELAMAFSRLLTAAESDNPDSFWWAIDNLIACRVPMNYRGAMQGLQDIQNTYRWWRNWKDIVQESSRWPHLSTQESPISSAGYIADEFLTEAVLIMQRLARELMTVNSDEELGEAIRRAESGCEKLKGAEQVVVKKITGYLKAARITPEPHPS